MDIVYDVIDDINYQQVFKINLNIPSFIRFLRPSVPILSQKLSSLSSFFADKGGRGDFDLGDAIAAQRLHKI